MCRLLVKNSRVSIVHETAATPVPDRLPPQIGPKVFAGALLRGMYWFRCRRLTGNTTGHCLFGDSIL
jgi:hypothetical protein